MIMKVTFLIAAYFVFVSSARAQSSNTAPEGQVRIEKSEDLSEAYRARRGTHGAVFSAGLEYFYPTDYRSLYDDAYIEHIIQTKKIKLASFELGYKYNFKLGSLAVLGNYATGAENGNVSGAERRLVFTKQGLSINFSADALFNEPYLVPYAQAGVHQFLVNEKKPTEDLSATAQVALNYKFGILFQIDWIEKSIDKSAKADGLISSGLENTYIDVYFSEHLAASNALDPAAPIGTVADPNLASSSELGIGLKLEF